MVLIIRTINAFIYYISSPLFTICITKPHDLLVSGPDFQSSSEHRKHFSDSNPVTAK